MGKIIIKSFDRYSNHEDDDEDDEDDDDDDEDDDDDDGGDDDDEGVHAFPETNHMENHLDLHPKQTPKPKKNQSQSPEAFPVPFRDLILGA